MMPEMFRTGPTLRAVSGCLRNISLCQLLTRTRTQINTRPDGPCTQFTTNTAAPMTHTGFADDAQGSTASSSLVSGISVYKLTVSLFVLQFPFIVSLQIVNRHVVCLHDDHRDRNRYGIRRE